MLEILVLIALSKKIGEMVRAKGYKRGWFIALTVVLWLGGELMGAIIGALVAGLLEATECLVYLFALSGAALGALVAYGTAKTLPDKAPVGVDLAQQ